MRDSHLPHEPRELRGSSYFSTRAVVSSLTVSRNAVSAVLDAMPLALPNKHRSKEDILLGKKIPVEPAVVLDLICNEERHTDV